MDDKRNNPLKSGLNTFEYYQYTRTLSGLDYRVKYPILKMLADHPNTFKYLDLYGVTDIEFAWACTIGSIKLVRYFLDGMSGNKKIAERILNYKTDESLTPLSLACSWSHPEIVKLVLDFSKNEDIERY